MSVPALTTIAGCNGSGKSSFSSAFTVNGPSSFDYDKVYKEKYNSLIVSDIQNAMAHNLSHKQLEDSVDDAITNNRNFTYETNFNSTPLYWPRIFKNAKYKLKLIFFCLDSVDEAKRRVQIRVENGGHFVPNDEIIERYHRGFENLNRYWDYFDEVFLFDTSTYKKEPRFLLSLINQKLADFNDYPAYLSSLLPSIKIDK